MAKAQEEVKQKEVYAGVYVNQIYASSLKDNQFSVDFWIWFRWKGDGIKPAESFDLVNGRIESRESLYEDTLSGLHYAAVRVNATMTKFWDIRRFPLDNHVLTVEIEDNENEEYKLKYIPDVENSAVDPGVQVPGWRLGKTWPAVHSHGYKTNYGDISLPTGNESVYSRFIYAMEIIRPGYGYFLKLFLSVFIATLISFLAFAIKPTDLDPRFGLGIGAIFAAVASEYVITSSLPDTNLITMADKLHILAIVFIFLSLLESTISLIFFGKGKEKISRRLDTWSLIVFLAVYITLNATVIFGR
ncbi:MAG: hypothetical protein HY541_08875 [Deltaproteobacteria bacterium]|nr:hypothetical protein [Deltaproteobacteria bacterium]